MDFRADAVLVAAEIALQLERLAIEAGDGTVGTIGELTVSPGLINVVPGATPMAHHLVEALDEAAARAGEPSIRMPSGAAHDTMYVADHAPTAMVFVPCLDGISHSPLE